MRENLDMSFLEYLKAKDRLPAGKAKIAVVASADDSNVQTRGGFREMQRN
jgi:hypothetical protein